MIIVFQLLGLLCSGLSLLLVVLSAKEGVSRTLNIVLIKAGSLLAMLISILALIGQAARLPDLYRWQSTDTGIAQGTAVCVLMLGLAQYGLTALVSEMIVPPRREGTGVTYGRR